MKYNICRTRPKYGFFGFFFHLALSSVGWLLQFFFPSQEPQNMLENCKTNTLVSFDILYISQLVSRVQTQESKFLHEFICGICSYSRFSYKRIGVNTNFSESVASRQHLNWYNHNDIWIKINNVMNGPSSVHRWNFLRPLHTQKWKRVTSV